MTWLIWATKTDSTSPISWLILIRCLLKSPCLCHCVMMGFGLKAMFACVRQMHQKWLVRAIIYEKWWMDTYMALYIYIYGGTWHMDKLFCHSATAECITCTMLTPWHSGTTDDIQTQDSHNKDGPKQVFCSITGSKELLQSYQVHYLVPFVHKISISTRCNWYNWTWSYWCCLKTWHPWWKTSAVHSGKKQVYKKQP